MNALELEQAIIKRLQTVIDPETGVDVWLDVRTQREYDQLRIVDSRIKLIPLGRLRERIEELPRDMEIIAFCKISLRAYEAQRILQEHGFENVSFMDGGITAWPFHMESGVSSPQPV